MKLTELKDKIDIAVHFQTHPEDIEVVITTELPYATAGERPCERIKYASMGFDWESGQFRITPEATLMRVEHKVPQSVIKWKENYYCPKCQDMISKKKKNIYIRFCPMCGTALEWGN